MKRRDLTAQEKDDAQRLTEAWEAYKAAHPGASQEWLGNEAGIGGQSAVSQYLLAKIPLNLEALLRLCRVIQVAPNAISPRLMDEFFGRSPGLFGLGSAELTAFQPVNEVKVNPGLTETSEGVKSTDAATAEELKQQIMQAVADEDLSDELLNAIAWMIRAGIPATARGDQHHSKTVKIKHGRSANRRRTGTG